METIDFFFIFLTHRFHLLHRKWIIFHCQRVGDLKLALEKSCLTSTLPLVLTGYMSVVVTRSRQKFELKYEDELNFSGVRPCLMQIMVNNYRHDLLIKLITGSYTLYNCGIIQIVI